MRYNLVWGRLYLNCTAIYEKRKLFQTRLFKHNLLKNWTYSICFNFRNKVEWFLDFNYVYFMGLFEFVVGEWICWQCHNTNPGYQVQCITNVAPGRSANEIAASHQINIKYHMYLELFIMSVLNKNLVRM
jgi:hypothetical protein